MDIEIDKIIDEQINNQSDILDYEREQCKKGEITEQVFLTFCKSALTYYNFLKSHEHRIMIQKVFETLKFWAEKKKKVK